MSKNYQTLLTVGDNFEIKRTNFLSVLDNNPDKTQRFYRWIRFLNEHSNVHFSLTANVQLNVDMLEYIHMNSTIVNIDENIGFQFPLVDETIRISKDDLNELLHFPRDNLMDDPTSDELLKFFRSIQVTLHNGKIPRYFYKNHLPKEWNMFFTIISYTFSPKTGGWHRLSILLQKIGLAVAYNLSINFGYLIMEKILENLVAK